MIMGLANNTYAFDDSSILKLCGINIPLSYRIFFKNNKLTARNYPKLRKLIDKLKKKNIPPFKFVPAENIEANIIKAANNLLEGHNIQMLGKVFKTEIIDQLMEFHDIIKKEFEDIQKDDDIAKIKATFLNNAKKLTKGDSLPQDDDLKIIAGYYKFCCEGKKYLISGDEHFWGYADLILNNFKICIIKEWECHLTSV